LECGLACAEALEEAILAEGPETIAAFIVEPVMGEYGVIVPPEAYFQRVGEICDTYGLLLIADEVTTGFGRTGKLFASERWERRPDIMCLGKAISGGYQPLSATLATEAVYQRFRGPDNYLTHGSTNSGHPIAAAVSLAAIDIIIGENLAENAAQIGDYLCNRFDQLMEKHEVIGDVRGQGLMLALELVEDRQKKTPLSQERTFEIGVDIHVRGLMHSVQGNQLRFFPPLIIDEAIADEMVTIVDRSLRSGLRANIGRKVRLVKEFALSRIG
jgi:adenosylmethionine-8-amino-7-oxononanoate aminotransferase